MSIKTLGIVAWLSAAGAALPASASIIDSPWTGGSGMLFTSSASVATPNPGNDNVPGLSPNTLSYVSSFTFVSDGSNVFDVLEGPATEYTVDLTITNNTGQAWTGYTLYVGGGTLAFQIPVSFVGFDFDLAPTISGPGAAFATTSSQTSNIIVWSNLNVAPGDTVQFGFNLDFLSGSGGWQVQQLPTPVPAPASALLPALGVGLGLKRRRK